MKDVERRETGTKRRKIKVKPATTDNLTLEIKPSDTTWYEDQITIILSKTLEKSLNIYLPLFYVLLMVFYWVYYTCSMK